MSRIVVTNPRSRVNRRRPHDAACFAERLKARQVAPDSLEALAALAPEIAAADELFVHGGDGTIHQVLTALHNAGLTAPTLTLLRAGTMNIIADSVGQRASAQRVVDAIVDGSPTTVAQRCPMRISFASAPPCLGFLAGGGILSRFLEVYYDTPDPTPLDAGWLLARGAASALVGGRLAARLTRPFEGALTVDGVDWPNQPWTAVAVGTVDQIGLGFRPFPKVHEVLGRMHVVGIGSGIGALAFELPRVFLGRGLARSKNQESTARSLRLSGDGAIPWMVDGDLYDGTGGVEITVEEAVRFRVVRG